MHQTKSVFKLNLKGLNKTCGSISGGRQIFGSGGSYKASNSSILCLVLPWRICRSVLYLSRPAWMFLAWSRSFWVFLFSYWACSSSELRACGEEEIPFMDGCPVPRKPPGLERLVSPESPGNEEAQEKVVGEGPERHKVFGRICSNPRLVC